VPDAFRVTSIAIVPRWRTNGMIDKSRAIAVGSIRYINSANAGLG